VIRLLASELLRARSRRLLWVAVVAIALGIVVGMSIAVANTDRPTQEQLDRAQRLYERDLRQCLDGQWFPPDEPLPEGYTSLEEFCNDQVTPQSYLSGVMELSQLPELLRGTSTVVLLLAALLGASLVGAEWSAGSMATVLAWEPRRIRLFAVRAAVVVVVAVAMAVFASVLLGLTYRLGVSLKGVTTGADDWLGQTGGVIGRIAVLAAIWSLFAYATTMIARSTAGGLGILFVELVVIEGFLRGLRPSIERWVLVQNATSWVSDQPFAIINQQTRQVISYVSPTAALVTLLVYAGIGLVLAAAWFRTRDVT